MENDRFKREYSNSECIVGDGGKKNNTINDGFIKKKKKYIIYEIL